MLCLRSFNKTDSNYQESTMDKKFMVFCKPITINSISMPAAIEQNVDSPAVNNEYWENGVLVGKIVEVLSGYVEVEFLDEKRVNESISINDLMEVLDDM